MQAPDYESGDLMDDPRGVVLAAVGLLTFVVVCIAGAWFIYWLTGPRSEVPGVEGVVQPGGTPMPADEVTVERIAAEKSWDARSRAWEWVDRERGIARIPVDRAAEIMLGRGFPTRERPVPPIAMRGGS
ncbi:MAG TPA: hypothetical protein VIK91_18520 [Nannocystis sp.]